MKKNLRIKKPTATKPASTPPTATGLFFTVSELADRWKLSARHIRREIASGELTALHFGRAVRVSAREVALYEARCAGVT